MDGSCQLQALAVVVPVKDPLVSIEQEPGWASELVWPFWRREKSFATSGDRRRIP
jgi:hypothetical protein